MKGRNLLNKMELKLGKFAIPNLMLYIVIGMGVMFAFDYLFPDMYLMQYILFDRDLIFKGQVWRAISFILMPTNSGTSMVGPFFMVIAMYFYWMCGTQLEHQWGTFKFNVFYFSGMLGAMIGGFITGYTTSYYLNLSLFLAFAILYPNVEFRLFFILPIKAKYIAYVDAAYILLSLIILPFHYKLIILLALINIILFFGKGFYDKIKFKMKFRKARRNFNKQMTYRDDDED